MSSRAETNVEILLTTPQRSLKPGATRSVVDVTAHGGYFLLAREPLSLIFCVICAPRATSTFPEVCRVVERRTGG